MVHCRQESHRRKALAATARDEIYSDEVMASLRLRADWVLEHRLPLRSVGHATSSERDFESHEALYMPLSDDGETINMMLLASIYTFSSRA